MALLLEDGTCFLHCPKTGGMWIREVLKANDIPFRVVIPKPPYEQIGFEGWIVNLTNDERHHLAVAPFGADRIITCIREPVGWYESYWLHRHLGFQIFDNSDFDRAVKAHELWDYRSHFSEWLSRIMVRWPDGFYMELLHAYVSKATVVMDFSFIQDHIGTVLGRGDLKLPPPANTRNDQDWHCTDEEAERILAYENPRQSILNRKNVKGKRPVFLRGARCRNE